MFCSNCGAKLEADAKFCGNCGQMVPVMAPLAAPVAASIAAEKPAEPAAKPAGAQTTSAEPPSAAPNDAPVKKKPRFLVPVIAALAAVIVFAAGVIAAPRIQAAFAPKEHTPNDNVKEENTPDTGVIYWRRDR
jgi:uncharacterized membrane protein YvbJ